MWKDIKSTHAQMESVLAGQTVKFSRRQIDIWGWEIENTFAQMDRASGGHKATFNRMQIDVGSGRSRVNPHEWKACRAVGRQQIVEGKLMWGGEILKVQSRKWKVCRGAEGNK